MPSAPYLCLVVAVFASAAATAAGLNRGGDLATFVATSVLTWWWCRVDADTGGRRRPYGVNPLLFALTSPLGLALYLIRTRPWPLAAARVLGFYAGLVAAAITGFVVGDLLRGHTGFA